MTKLVTAEGRPMEPTLHTVAQIKLCGTCHHGKLIPKPDGSFDFNMRTCLQGPPHYVQQPVVKNTMQGPQIVGMNYMWAYPEVGISMRGCAQHADKTADDSAVEKLDAAGAAVTPQASN